MLISVALGLLTGTSALNVFPTLPQTLHIGIGCGCLLVTSLLIWFYKSSFKIIAVFLLMCSIGFAWAYIGALQNLQWELPKQDISKVIKICGIVNGITQQREQTLRFDVALNQYQDKVVTNALIRLHWQNPQYSLKHGDTFCGTVKLKPRWHLSNPGARDQEKQLFLEGIHATGKLVSLDNYQPSHAFSLTAKRQKFNDNLASMIGDKPFLGVIQATTLGVYHNITPEQWRLFQATGTVHAIAISGLHISVIAMLCGGWATFLARRSYRLTNRMPAKCYGAIFALIGAIVYSAIAGFSIPTQRALVMILIAITALLKRQRLFSWHALALACIGILLIDPLAPLQIGFWLSFACVGALIYGGSQKPKRWWEKWIVPQSVVFIGLIPLCALFFQQLQWLSPLANMITLPLIDFFIVPCCLVGLGLSFISTPLAKCVLIIANMALEVVAWILEKLIAIPSHYAEIGTVPWLYLLMALLASLILIAPKGIPGKHWAWLGFLPMLLYGGERPKTGECFFALLDVGQGLAAVIQTQHHTLLYDAGPQYGQSDNAGKRIIKPFLLANHLNYVDKVIISHGDLDHRAGLAAFEQNEIGEILSSEPHRLDKPSSVCKAGDSWEWDGVRFTLLNPMPNITQSKNRNDHSCVLRVATAYHSILLTGDIEHFAEQSLLNSYPSMLPSSILVVPHHGSLTSSSQAFIQAVSPIYALFPVGMANQYGFPKRAVLQRYEEGGAKNLLVSHTGALIFRLTNKATLAPPLVWREKNRRYWHSRNLEI